MNLKALETNQHLPPVEAVIFDADGTLVNTEALIIEGFIATLTVAGFAEHANEDNIRASIGGHLRECFARMTGLAETDERVDEMMADIDMVQDQLAHTVIEPYPFVDYALGKLRERGIKTAIYTSGTTHQVHRNLEAVDIEVERYFDAMVTADDGLAAKPNPEGLIECMRRLDVTAEATIFVGDMAVDMHAGAAANVGRLIGVSHGLEDDSVLFAAGAHDVIHSLDHVLRHALAHL